MCAADTGKRYSLASNKLRNYIIIKWGFCGFLFLAIVIFYFNGDLHLTGFISSSVILLFCGILGVFVKIAIKKGKSVNSLTHFSLSFDLFLAITAIYFTGGIENNWLFFPIFCIFVANYLFTFKMSLIYATVSFVSIVIMFLLEYFNIIPHFGTYGFPDNFYTVYPSYWRDSLLGVFILFYFSAFIGGYFTRVINQSAARLQQSNIALEQEVNDRRRIEKELRKYQDHLEKLVELRTAELRLINEDLKTENTVRRQAQKQLKVSLKEKEVLLKEIHHRVKNNLQIICSLLRLQSVHVKDKQALELFEESLNRVQSIALIHERLYQSQDLACIDLAQYIDSLANGLYRIYNHQPDRITMDVEVEDVSFEINRAVPCGLIINELISNALKHAFPPDWKGKGKIKILIRPCGDNMIEMSVSDNGIGMPKDFRVGKSESLGMHLVHILVKDQLDGKIRLNRRGGTKFQVTFKK